MRHLAGLIETVGSELRRFGPDQSGATAVEYAIVASGVAAAVAATVWSLGESVRQNLYERVSGAF